MRMLKEERQFHRKVAARSFNGTWDYLDMKKRTAEEDQEMLHLAHASRYHWGLVGSPRNLAVGDWLLSRVYADMGQPQLALRFAKLALTACRRSKLVDIAHTANEAMARAYAASGDYPKAKRHLDEARRQLDRLKLSKADKAVYLDQISQTERLIGRK
jgi:tetratricopeptide (TPR) repeat protein